MELEIHATVSVNNDATNPFTDIRLPATASLLKCSLPQILEKNFDTYIDIRSMILTAALKGERSCCVRVLTESFYEIRSLLDECGYKTIVSYVEDGSYSDVSIIW